VAEGRLAMLAERPLQLATGYYFVDTRTRATFIS
jgi:hypothetical protein